MNRPCRIAVVVLVNVLVVVALLEGALRALPGLIPLASLVGFQPTIRNEIAERRGLPRLAAMQPVARDDGGPWLAVYGPSAVVNFPGSTFEGATTRVTMDRRGFCNSTEAASGGHSDIVTIGDSFTFCTAVAPELTWTAQLARRTGKTAYNLGRMGIGILEYVQLLKRYGLALSPRTVVMNVYEGNDLRDAHRFIEARRRGGRTGASRARSPERWWLNHSYVAATAAGVAGYSYDHDNDFGNRQDRFMRKLRWRYKDPDFAYKLRFAEGNVRFNRDDADMDEPRFARALSENRIDPAAWKAMRSGLRSYVALAREHGFQPIVSYTPSAYTVYGPVVAFHDPTLSPVMRKFSDVQREFYLHEAPTLGYRFVDLTPALQQSAAAHGRSPLLYRNDDMHLTPQGHALVADALAAALRQP